MPRISIGIDQSYTGCAVVAYNATAGTADEAVFDFSPTTAGTGVARLVFVRHALLTHFHQLARLGQVTYICYEGYAYGAKFRREELGELGAMMKTALADTFPQHVERRIHAVAPATVKKFVTGSGVADKDKMLMAVYKRWQYEASCHDAADAYVLARIAEALARPEPPEWDFQRQVLDTIRNPPKRSRSKTAA